MTNHEQLTFPSHLQPLFTPYLPPASPPSHLHPFLTLTFATSLDCSLSLAPGTRTPLSGPASKSMTHFLRSRHDAILIGSGTAIADDPALNCRIEGASSPQPVVLDARGRWAVHEGSKVLQVVREGGGLAPIVMVGEGVDVPAEREEVLQRFGGKYVWVKTGENGRFGWEEVLRVIAGEGLRSVMVEGGGEVINSLLKAPENKWVDSVIVTVAPTWLGKGGVVVSPDRTVDEQGRPAPPVRLTGTKWIPLGEDVVLCGEILRH